MRGQLRGMIQCQGFRTRHSSGYLRYIPRYRSTFSSTATSRNVDDELPPSQPIVEPGQQNGVDTSASNTKTGEPVGHNEQVPPYKRRQLPISPLMDPEFHAARTKYETPKPLPSGSSSEFSKRLANNIFAQALATPIRQCAVQMTSLPSFFLQDFELISHPTTGAIYNLPRSLAPKHKPQSLKEGPSLPWRTPSIGSRHYVSLRQALFQTFLYKKSGNHRVYERFGLGGPMTSQRRAALAKAVWRLDMDTFILSRLRNNIGYALLHLAQRKKGYIVPCADWQDAASKEQSGAVLWLGRNLHTEEGKATAEEEEEQDVPPGEFDILHMKGEVMGGKKIVPVYNVRGMLGKEWVEKLRDRNHPFDAFGAQVVVIKNKNGTKDILMDLWRLQGYIATYGEEMTVEKKPDKVVMPVISPDVKFRSIRREK